MRRLLTLLNRLVNGRMSEQELRRILASVPVNTNGVLGIPWGATKETILAGMPSALAASVRRRPGANPNILRGTATLGRHSLVFSFLLEDGHLDSLSLGIPQACGPLHAVLAECFGPPSAAFIMPGVDRTVEDCRVWELNGF